MPISIKNICLNRIFALVTKFSPVRYLWYGRGFLVGLKRKLGGGFWVWRVIR